MIDVQLEVRGLPSLRVRLMVPMQIPCTYDDSVSPSRLAVFILTVVSNSGWGTTFCTRNKEGEQVNMYSIKNFSKFAIRKSKLEILFEYNYLLCSKNISMLWFAGWISNSYLGLNLEVH